MPRYRHLISFRNCGNPSSKRFDYVLSNFNHSNILLVFNFLFLIFVDNICGRLFVFCFGFYVALPQANGLACQAKYVAGSIPSYAAGQSLFVKQHAY